MKWDPGSCSCRKKTDIQNLSRINPEQTVQTRPQGDARYNDVHDSTSFYHNNEIALDSRCAHCLDCMNKAGILSVYRNQGSPLFESWTLLGVCGTLIGILFSTTLYYWRKSKKLLKSLSGKKEEGIEDILCSTNLGNNTISQLPCSSTLLSEHEINYDHNGDGNTTSNINDIYFNNSSTHLQMNNNNTLNLNNGRCKGNSPSKHNNTSSTLVATVEDFRNGKGSSSECRRKNYSSQSKKERVRHT
ncbi:unnamed protein product [Lepeophtheirus salmonis]|nr:unnamed protein product [Lepeophtheirus salmonis]CAF2890896.1 unnamed protein product [Lepeophtheirus salmonis]